MQVFEEAQAFQYLECSHTKGSNRGIFHSNASDLEADCTFEDFLTLDLLLAGLKLPQG